MKPFYRINLPISTDKLLAPTFNLPEGEHDFSNPYLRFDNNINKQPLNNPKFKMWIHRFGNEQTSVPVLDILSNELIDFMKTKELEMGAIFIFYAPPGGKPGSIHSDWGTTSFGRKANFAINWTIGEPKKHDMVWYEPINPALDKTGWPVSALPAKLPYSIPTWNRNHVTEIARYSINEPTLVRTDIPHNAENFSTQPRWCFSIRTGLIINHWDEAVDLFKDIITDD